jgi:thiol-disulfide isomerase/thioredoxin
MTPPVLRAAGAALLVVLGIWAGAGVYLSHSAHQRHPGIPVPAGHASAPSPSDLARVPGGNASEDDTPPMNPDFGAEPSPGTLPPAKIPERLPQFALKDRAGKLTSMTDFQGQSLIINFWATWCAPCQREIPLLQALQAQWAPQGVTVIGVAVDFRDKVLEFAERFKIRYPLLIGEQDALDAAAALGVDSPVFPFTVFTDRRGQLVALYIGELHRAQAELILLQVAKLNQNLTNLADARRAIAHELSAR